MKTSARAIMEGMVKSISTKQADIIWNWLDGNPNAIEDMIQVLVKAHPELIEPLESQSSISNKRERY